jgi:hypothetical protein
VADPDQIVIGANVWYPDGKELIEKYGQFSSQTAFSPANLPTLAMRDPNSVGILAMSFQRDKLSQAASLAKAALAGSN